LLYLGHQSAGVFGAARVERIQYLSGHAASALENSRLYEQVRRSNEQLEERVRQRTEELRDRHQQLHAVLDAVSQGLITVNCAGTVVGDVSAQAIAWFGPVEAGQSLIDVFTRTDEEFGDAFASFFRAALGSECLQAQNAVELDRRLALGGAFLSLELRRVEFGESLTLVVITDVTEQERKNQLEIELRHAQKLESVGQLAAGIAHEINTPTQFVDHSLVFLEEGYRDLRKLLEEYRRTLLELRDEPRIAAAVGRLANAEEEADLEYLDENAVSAFRRASDGISRVASIVSAMKEFAHPEQREKSLADLNRSLETTLTIARNEYKHVADVETQFGEIPPVTCHIGDMNQVFLNLIVNAAHAITDVVRDTGKKGLIRISTTTEDGSVCVRIEDSGSGVPEDIRHRVFDPFFTTKEVGKGTGQGLAIARSIVVDRHGGSLTFDSTVGEGTRFTITLPV
jgi:signal transduction histidine kinase